MASSETGARKKLKIFWADFPFPDLQWERKKLEESSLQVELEEEWCETAKEVIAGASGADALLVHHAPVTAAVIEELDQLKVIGRYGAGYDMVDVEAATAAGIPVINDPGYCVEELTTHVLALMLTLNRKILPLNDLVQGGGWQSDEDFRSAGEIHRLAGQKLGVVGLGRTGMSLAEKAEALGLELLVWDRRAEEKLASRSDLKNLKAAELKELLEKADIISLHLPLTSETEGIIGREEFELMKEDAMLINTARGGLLQEKALVTALTEGEIAAAGLDVFQKEPLPADHPLLRLAEERDNLILTPHAAFYSEEAEAELRESILEQVIAALQGEKPDHIINDEVW